MKKNKLHKRRCLEDQIDGDSFIKFFLNLKDQPRDAWGNFNDLMILQQVFCHLDTIKYNKMQEYTDFLIKHVLYDPNPKCREIMISLLGYDDGRGFAVPKLRELAYDLWLNDVNDDVKAAALNEWSSLYYVRQLDYDSQMAIIAELKNIVISDKYDLALTKIALKNLLSLSSKLNQEVAKEILNLELDLNLNNLDNFKNSDNFKNKTKKLFLGP